MNSTIINRYRYLYPWCITKQNHVLLNKYSYINKFGLKIAVGMSNTMGFNNETMGSSKRFTGILIRPPTLLH